MNLAPCAGIIVIDGNNTILVSTKNNNYSFPKGKRNKGETIIDTAWRELNEETGLEKKHIQLIDNFSINETSNKGNIAITYFVGKLIEKPQQLKFDSDELHNAEFIKIDDAYKLESFKERRKDILRQVYEKVLNT